MKDPGKRIVSVYRKGTRNKDGDAVGTTLVHTYGGISLQQTGTTTDTLGGRAEQAVTSWTLIFPPGSDVRAGDRYTVHDYTADGRELKLVGDGHPHEPQFRSGRPSNVIVRAKEVDTV